MRGQYDQGVDGVGNSVRNNRRQQIASAGDIQGGQQCAVDGVFNGASPASIRMGKPEYDTYDVR
jgi:hypothetical protein